MGKDKPELPSRNDGGEPSWFKMTGWYNLRSTILLVEILAVFIFTVYFASGFELSFLRQNALIGFIGIMLVAFWLLHWLFLGRFISKWIALIVLVIAYALGGYFGLNYFGGHWETWSRETKQNLHAIQLALERYADDNEGHYPQFLVGGELESGSVDPLVKMDTWHAYPRCPSVSSNSPYGRSCVFFRKVAPWAINPDAIIIDPQEIRALQVEYNDPYRANNPTARFGKDSTMMGNVAADHRFPQGSFGYPFWERKASNTDKLTIALQGQFYYKALYSPGATEPDAYVLMAFGSAGFERYDALTTVPGGHELDCRLPDGSGIGMGVPVLPKLGLKGDGIPDGVIIALSGGWAAKEFD